MPKLLAYCCALFLALAVAGCGERPAEEAPSTDMPAAAPPPPKDLQTTVREAKDAATQDGKINCCLKHPCTQCVIAMGACPCAENLRAGNPVCHECKGGWEAGDGAVEGVTPGEVKVMPRNGM